MGFNLLVMRHGHYFTRGELELSQEGRRQVEDVADQLVRAGYVPDVILSSYARRAEQSAEICADRFNQVSGVRPAHHTSYGLKECVDEKEVIRLFEKWPWGRDIPEPSRCALLITHLPTVKHMSGLYGVRCEAPSEGTCIALKFAEDWPKVSKAIEQHVFKPA